MTDATVCIEGFKRYTLKMLVAQCNRKAQEKFSKWFGPVEDVRENQVMALIQFCEGTLLKDGVVPVYPDIEAAVAQARQEERERCRREEVGPLRKVCEVARNWFALMPVELHGSWRKDETSGTLHREIVEAIASVQRVQEQQP